MQLFSASQITTGVTKLQHRSAPSDDTPSPTCYLRTLARGQEFTFGLWWSRYVMMSITCTTHKPASLFSTIRYSTGTFCTSNQVKLPIMYYS